jgi:predicted adenine nucleotide alpha hydrolase (AANH) superfamily ATPase
LKTSGFYKQSFCGCCYSLTERMTEKHGSIWKEWRKPQFD